MLRSAAYRIAVISAIAFVLATLAIGLAIYLAAHSALQRQLESAISQANSSLLAEYADDGLDGLAESIALRERSSSNSLGYAVFSSKGRKKFGALDTEMPPFGWHRIIFLDPHEGPDPARALVTELQRGDRLVVAADLEPVEAIDGTIVRVFGFGFAAMVFIGTVLALVLGRYLKIRLERIAQASRAFAAGDLTRRARVGPRRDEFDQLAASLNAMLDRIAGLLRNLQQVTSDLAHDMRTPLTQLRNHLELLRSVPGHERDEMIETAIEKSDEILGLFSVILRIAELEQAGVRRNFKQLDLGDLVHELGDAHRPLAEDSGHVLVVSEPGAPILVWGDRELLAQALINLIQNALLHTPEGSEIEIGAMRERGHPKVFVRDNGPGIAVQDRRRVRDRFVRLEEARSTPGNGLGLSLAEAITQAHGAMLELRDADPGLEVALVFNEGEA